MCLARITSLIAFCAFYASGPAWGFEVEGNRTYAVDGVISTLRILSTADEAAFGPIIEAYQSSNAVNVDYTTASSSEVMKAVYQEGVTFDLVISSAMDLQTKLANDGFAQDYKSAPTAALPDWAKWRDQVFAFTQEPAVLVVSKAFFEGEILPSNRNDLIQMLRENPDRFRGKVGTYDVRTSGLGYLFATQDSRNSESFWRLTEVMGRLEPKLYCCSGQMISDVASGDLAFAYNVLGSYTESRLPTTDGIKIAPMNDFLSVMLRTVLIPKTAQNTLAAQQMVDFLVTMNERTDVVARSGLPPIDPAVLAKNDALRPIRLGPGLLVFLDRLKRENFLRSWTNSIEQN
jgi:iron(III) transport system substrate-binding protein